MNRDKIGTQRCYIHQCTKRYVDVHSMSVSQSCLCSFLCNPYIHFKFPKFFIYLLLLCIAFNHELEAKISKNNRTYPVLLKQPPDTRIPLDEREIDELLSTYSGF